MDFVLSWSPITGSSAYDQHHAVVGPSGEASGGFFRWSPPKEAPASPAPRLPLADILSLWEKDSLVLEGPGRVGCPLRIRAAHPVDEHTCIEVRCVPPPKVSRRSKKAPLAPHYNLTRCTRTDRRAHGSAESLIELQECLEEILCLPRPLSGTEVDF